MTSLPPHVRGYRLTELLGVGGFGQVWKAQQLSTDKPVAVKVFVRRSGMDWHFLRREVERLVRLDTHPHIVTLLDADLEGEPPAYVMELMTLGTLCQRAGRAPSPSIEQILHWLDQICEALAFVHGKGLIHCDLKPDNILLDEQENVRVTDFGQSRVFTDASGALGTLLYMAPEQATLTTEGSPAHPDVQWDVYAVGASLYSLLTGHPPHSTPEIEHVLCEAKSLDARLEAYRRIVHGGVAPLVEGLRIKAIDRELSEIVLKCLAPDPAKRYRSIEALQADLRARREYGVVSPLAGDRVYRLRRFVRRRRTGVAVVTAIFLAAAGGTALWRERVKRIAESVEGLVEQGIASSDKGDWERAEAYFAEALAMHPTQPRALGNLCRLRKDKLASNPHPPMTDLLAGLELCDQAIAVEPSCVYSPRNWNTRGALCKRLQRYDDAITSYANAVRLSGECEYRDYELEVEALTNMGIAYALKGDRVNSEKTLRSAVELDSVVEPNSATGLRQCHSTRDLGVLELALERRSARDTIRLALSCFVGGESLNATEAAAPATGACQDAWTYLVHSRLQMTAEADSDASDALADLTRADALVNGRSPEIKRSRAWALLRTGKFADAIREAKAAIALGDDPPTASHYIISVAAAKSGQRELAETEAKAAMASWPADLRAPDSVKFTAPKGNLWFESARELEMLRAEVEALLR